MILSIITVNLNNADGLRGTLESVLSQKDTTSVTQHSFEHIIVDGGSNDGSLDLIQDYINRVNYPVKWVSESDDGIYQAMNKGTKMANGDYLLFLNSGDTLADITILQSLFSIVLVGEVVIGRINIASNSRIVTQDFTIFGQEVSLFGLLLRGIPHQGTLILRELQIRFPYDESYKINSDFKFFLETVILNNCSIQYVPLTISNYDNDGLSTNNPELQLRERYDIFRSLVPSRVCKDYEKWIPHYYELIRVEWLLKHPFFYRVYRAWASFGRLIYGCD